MSATPVLIRNSERSTYRRCRQLWYWHYVLGTEPTRSKGALKFGSYTHSALEVRYPPGKKRGPHPAETFTRLIEEHGNFPVWTEDEEDARDAESLGVAMLEGYIEEYGEDKGIEVIQPEMTFQIDITDQHGEYLCTMVGSFDACVRWKETGRIGLLEHKTGKSIEHVQINSGYGEQSLTYHWAANIWLRHLGLMAEDEQLDMVLFNWLRKGFPDERPRNKQGHRLNKPNKGALVAACKKHKLQQAGTMEVLINRLLDAGVDVGQLGEVSLKQPRALFARQEMQIGEPELDIISRRIRAEAWEMAQVRKGNIPIFKNPTKDCSWCDYRDVCELHEMGGDYKGVLALEFQPWDPYAEHREALEND